MKSVIIGIGVIGGVHIDVMEAIHESIDAICDIDVTKMEKYDYPKYTDYKQMIEEVKPDVVHICTPHYIHAEMCMYCLERDINVIVEKPLATTIEDLNKILEMEKVSKAQIGVCFQNRYRYSTKFIENFIKDKEVYDAYGVVNWNRGKSYYDSAEWRGTEKYECGGVLINQAIHTVDLLQHFTSRPDSIIAVVTNLTHDYIEVEDNVTLITKGKIPFTLFASSSSTASFEVTINVSTSGGVITLVDDNVYINGERQNIIQDDYYYGKKCYGRGHESMFLDYYDCLRNNKKYSLNGLSAEPATRIVLSAYKSGGKEIKL